MPDCLRAFRRVRFAGQPSPTFWSKACLSKTVNRLPGIRSLAEYGVTDSQARERRRLDARSGGSTGQPIGKRDRDRDSRGEIERGGGRQGGDQRPVDKPVHDQTPDKPVPDKPILDKPIVGVRPTRPDATKCRATSIMRTLRIDGRQRSWLRQLPNSVLGKTIHSLTCIDGGAKRRRPASAPYHSVIRS